MAQLKMNNGEVSEDLLRHMIINSVRNYQKKYQADYGEIVLCTDASNTWRRDYFPQYKANRKKTRDASDMDWKKLFDTLQVVKEEIRDNFPYRYMYVETAEADDIIAILTKHAKEDVLIVSGDKDFQQLHKYDYVTQCIPNILSSDTCLDEGIRQTPLRKPIKDRYLKTPIEKDDKYYRNYLRNQTLIDLEFIPQNLEDTILEEFENAQPVHGKVFDYLRVNRLNELLNHVEDFRV